MVKLKFNEASNEWIQLEKGSKEKGSIYLDGKLKSKLDNVKKIMKKEWDCVIMVDGIEGSGKSTLAITIAWYISNAKIKPYNIVTGSNDAIMKLKELPNGSTLIIDEGSLVFSSKETMKKEQVKLIKIMNVIRQKRMCLIVVSPSFFDLNKYIAVQRSRFLVHVYTDRLLNRGRFTFFGQKKKRKLYPIGKKNYNSYAFPKSDFSGVFTKFEPFGETYKKMKEKSLFEAFDLNKDGIITPLEVSIGIIGYASAWLDANFPQINKIQRALMFNVSKVTLWKYLKQFENNNKNKQITPVTTFS